MGDLELIQKAVAIQSGMAAGDTPTQKQLDKLVFERGCGFGSKVEIGGANGWPDETGYLTAVTGYDGNSFDTDGVVHIPQPWSEKGGACGVWQTIDQLVMNDSVGRVTIKSLR